MSLVNPVAASGTTTSTSEHTINRYYDPSTDQFLSIDPLVATTGQPYVFVNDDPLNAEDPLGDGFWQNLFCAAALSLTLCGEVAAELPTTPSDVAEVITATPEDFEAAADGFRNEVKQIIDEGPAEVDKGEEDVEKAVAVAVEKVSTTIKDVSKELSKIKIPPPPPVPPIRFLPDFGF
jgi:hypothetical protein